MSQELSSSDTFVIKEKIAALEAQLLEQSPSMPVLLREIHSIIKNDPEQATILSEEEIGIIVKGLSIQTKTVIAASIKKESAATTIKKATKAVKAAGGSLIDLF